MHVKPKRAPWTSTRTLACTSWSQGAANKIGRLADSINTKSAHQAYRVGDNERCGLLCCVARSLVPGMYRQRLQLIRTPWHHLVGYQSLVFGMYRQRRSSNALLGTISSAIKAWVLACIASACMSYAAAPPHQLSQPGSSHASPAPASGQLIRTPRYHLISYLHVSHRCNSNCCETVVLLDLRF